MENSNENGLRKISENVLKNTLYYFQTFVNSDIVDMNIMKVNCYQEI